jgi:nitrite reductase/ring-hydroxylating ferredoxin subunit
LIDHASVECPGHVLTFCMREGSSTGVDWMAHFLVKK